MNADLNLGRLITFYSYKGGTGRTMALANVACLLAQRPAKKKPVLVIDWDLEAPGLHRYIKPIESGASTGVFSRQTNTSATHEGLIELWSEIEKRIAGLKPDISSTKAGDIISEDLAADVMRSIDFEKYICASDVAGVSILTAGRIDVNYPSRVSKFPWEALYRRCPFLFRMFAESITEDYEYVLVDSRTGITDTSGICTMLLPEKLVVVFTPNRQSLTGIVDLVQNATKYRRRSDDLRTLLIFPLPSRIEASEPILKDYWRFGNSDKQIEGYQPAFETILKDAYDLPACDLGHYFDEIQIQHIPRYAYGEEIAVKVERGSDRLSLQRSYEAVTRWLCSTKGPWEAIDSVQEIVQEKEKLLKAQYEHEVKSATKKAGKRAWVLGGIGTIAATLIVAAISVPNLLRARMEANESAATSALRTINIAEVSYVTTYPDVGYACDLAVLAHGHQKGTQINAQSNSSDVIPTKNAAYLIDEELASGKKFNYQYKFTFCNAQDYRIMATPMTPSAGTKSFCSDASAVIRSDPNGRDCAASPPL